MMRVLTTSEYQAQAQPVLAQIFRNTDLYRGCPLLPTVAGRVLLSPYQYAPPDDLMAGIQQAANAAGEDGFYYAVVTPQDSHILPDYAYYRFYHFSDLSDYRATLDPIENVIFSPHGRWAILCSDAGDALLGCVPAVLPYLRAAVPTLAEQVFTVLDAWREEATWQRNGMQPDLTWLPELLMHVYGAEYATRLLTAWAFALPVRHGGEAVRVAVE